MATTVNDFKASASEIIGRKTAGSGTWERLTLSEVLDFVGSAAQGDILYRGASGWSRLGYGTSGYFLKTNGAGADPSWAAGGSSIALDDLSDVAISSPVNGDGVFYNGSSWANRRAYPDWDSKYLCAWAGGTNGVLSSNGFNGNAASVNGGTAPVVSVQSGESTQQSFTTAGTSGSTSNTSFNTNPTIDWSVPFDITFIVRTDASISDIRMWCAISASAPTNSDTYGGGAPTRAVFIRYSSVAGDAGWVGGNCNATNQQVTSSLGSIATSTRYRLRIRSDGSTAYFSVNGGAETSLATYFPTGSTRVGIVISVYTNANAAKTMHFQRLFGTLGA